MKTNKPWEIYCLLDPRDKAIRYVGVSHNGIQRLRAHLSVARRRLPGHKNCWILSLLNDGVKPEYQVVESGIGPDWKESESRWIKHFRDSGCKLTNMTEGGEGAPGRILSLESRAKIASGHKGRKVVFSAEHRKNLSEAGKRRGPPSEEHRKRLSEGQRGSKRAFTEAHKAALSISATGRKMSPETVAKVVAANRRRSEERKLNTTMVLNMFEKTERYADQTERRA